MCLQIHLNMYASANRLTKQMYKHIIDIRYNRLRLCIRVHWLKTSFQSKQNRAYLPHNHEYSKYFNAQKNPITILLKEPLFYEHLVEDICAHNRISHPLKN